MYCRSETSKLIPEVGPFMLKQITQACDILMHTMSFFYHVKAQTGRHPLHSISIVNITDITTIVHSIDHYFGQYNSIKSH